MEPEFLRFRDPAAGDTACRAHGLGKLFRHGKNGAAFPASKDGIASLDPLTCKKTDEKGTTH
jgi:hypothetical protein